VGEIRLCYEQPTTEASVASTGFSLTAAAPPAQPELDSLLERRLQDLETKETAFSTLQRAWETAKTRQEQDLIRRAEQLREQATAHRQAVDRTAGQSDAIQKRESQLRQQQREFEARCRQAEEHIARQKAALAEEQARIAQLRAEMERQQAEFQSVRDQLEAGTRAMEQARALLAAECVEVKKRVSAESGGVQPHSQIPSDGPSPGQLEAPKAESVLQPQPGSVTASEANNGCRGRTPEADVRYNAVMKRLFRVSRSRRGWLDWLWPRRSKHYLGGVPHDDDQPSGPHAPHYPPEESG